MPITPVSNWYDTLLANNPIILTQTLKNLRETTATLRIWTLATFSKKLPKKCNFTKMTKPSTLHLAAGLQAGIVVSHAVNVSWICPKLTNLPKIYKSAQTL